MFKDKVYDELDDISKLVEPFEYELNNEIFQLPDEIEVDYDLIEQAYSNDWGFSSISSSEIINKKAKELNLKAVAEASYDVSRDFYEFQVKDLEENDEIKLFTDKKELSHKIYLVKVKNGIDDAELEKIAKTKILRTIRRNLNSNRAVNKSRLNEVADLYGAYDVRKDRSYKGKVNKFTAHLEQLIDDRKLNIRDIGLCFRFAKWIVLYVRDGNLAALNNITRIKIMMHEQRPIYSIEEKEVV